jgi:hypothetical protein
MTRVQDEKDDVPASGSILHREQKEGAKARGPTIPFRTICNLRSDSFIRPATYPHSTRVSPAGRFDAKQRSVPMFPRSFSLLLIGAVCLAAGAIGNRSSQPIARTFAGKAAVRLAQSVPLSLAVLRTSSPSFNSSWRPRPKGLYETGEARGLQHVSLDLTALLDEKSISVFSGPMPVPSRLVIPLRC